MANLLDLVSIDSGFVRVATTGDIHGAAETRNTQNPFQNLLGAAWATHRVLLDLQKTSYIDSNGIGWLISSNKAMQTNGGKLVVHSINPARTRHVRTAEPASGPEPDGE